METQTQESFIDNFNFIKSIIKKYYSRNPRIRAELYINWLEWKKWERKLVYVDIQKWFKESSEIYNKLINDQDYINSFDNRCRVYDNTHFLHYTYWRNPHNFWEKDSNDKLHVDEEISKKFGFLESYNKVPQSLKKSIEQYFDRWDDIVLVGWSKEHCLKEIYNTFHKLGYLHVHIDKRFVY
jgi:hypothetical protein